jgi:hypothetical protein
MQVYLIQSCSFQFTHQMKFTPSLLFQSLNKVINYGIKNVLASFAKLLQPNVVSCFKQVTSKLLASLSTIKPTTTYCGWNHYMIPPKSTFIGIWTCYKSLHLDKSDHLPLWSHLLLDFSGIPMDLAIMSIFSPYFVQTSLCFPLWSHHCWILLGSH